jgi:hypothetical protein
MTFGKIKLTTVSTSMRSPFVLTSRLRRIRVPNFLRICQTSISCQWEARSSSLARRYHRWRASSLFLDAYPRPGHKDGADRFCAPLSALFRPHPALRLRTRPRRSHVARGQTAPPRSHQKCSRGCLPRTPTPMTLPRLSSTPTLFPSCSSWTLRARVTKV